MAWTPEQLKAIHDRGSNIIVSAGAGSGKTAVLSERILEYCKLGNDIRKVLVLTFTKAAAEEMKERIRTKLLDNELYQQADYIDAAYITTFDSYSLSLVKKYYYKLGVSKNISIMDSAMIEMKRNEIINDLFKVYYQDQNTDFISFLSKYSKQDDKEVASIINTICQKLDLLIDIDQFVNTYEEKYFSRSKVEAIADEYEIYAKSKINDFLVSLQALMDACALDPSSSKMYDGIFEFYNKLKVSTAYTDWYNLVTSYSFPRTSPKADLRVKEEKSLASDLLKELKEKVFNKYVFKEDMINEILSTKDDIMFLLNTCKLVIDKLFDYKKSVNLFDFNDIAKLAISLVYDNEDVRLELKNYYNEILVDEYQDTSDIQEVFLNAIENNNRYMVGDIKQSIYRFRNANPYIFKTKYDNYSKSIGGQKIDLTYNFRSREEVLNSINLLFNKLMTNEVGDANYIKEHQMQYGQHNYEIINQNIDFNIEALSYDKDLLEGFSNEELEAFIIGNNIKNIINNNSKVLKKDSFVDVTYSDFAILVDKAKSFVVFKQVFEYLNIPLSIEADLDLKDSILPKLFNNILVLINKTKNKIFDKEYLHAKTSIARSFIYEYSDEQIYKMIVLNEKTNLDDDILDLSLYNEITYSSLFYKICEKLKIYEKLSLIGNVDNSIVILEAIHNMLKSFNEVGYSLNDVTDYLNKLFSSDIKLPYSLVEGNSNSVRIMTIHKSKGLEFAYCYFPLLSSSFNQQDQRASIGLDRNYGVYIPYADEGKSNTILKPLIANAINKADISEKVRLFYVALTRAREKMILVMPKIEYKRTRLDKFKSFHEMLSATALLDSYTKEIDLESLGISKKYKVTKAVEEVTGNEIISYDTPICIKQIQESRISKSFNSLPDKNIKKSVELGLELHAALEAIDFKNPKIDELPTSDFIKNTIRKVLSLSIFDNVANAKVYQEYEFYMTDNTDNYHGIIDLFIEHEDHIDIIDYKLSNTDSKEYIRQLSIYKKYIETISNKSINVYLLSILRNDLKKLDL